MHRTMMPATEWDRELIADLTAKGTGLGEPEVVGVRGLAAARHEKAATRAAANRHARIIALMPPAIGAHVIAAARRVRDRAAVVIPRADVEVVWSLS
jgi:hypothetical protein